MTEELPPADEIARLEERIEHFAAVAEGCRKFIVAAKTTIAAGGVALAGMLFGLWDGSPGLLVGALAAMIGGVVVSGSNASTRDHALAAAAEADARRAALIDGMPLRLVPDPGAERR